LAYEFTLTVIMSWQDHWNGIFHRLSFYRLNSIPDAGEPTVTAFLDDRCIFQVNIISVKGIM